MAISLHIRDLPLEVHQVLTRRAGEQRMSLRQYLVGVLTEHAQRPTVEEWLAAVATLPAHELTTSAAETLAAARDEAELEVARFVGRS
jgi:hypothetical protein